MKTFCLFFFGFLLSFVLGVVSVVHCETVQKTLKVYVTHYNKGNCKCDECVCCPGCIKGGECTCGDNCTCCPNCKGHKKHRHGHDKDCCKDKKK